MVKSAKKSSSSAKVQKLKIKIGSKKGAGKENSNKQPFQFEKLKRGMSSLSGKTVLLTWSLVNMILMFSFVSMLRATMMRPVMEQPIDNTRSLIESGKTPMMTFGKFWLDYMRTSENIWYRQVGEKVSSKFLSMM